MWVMIIIFKYDLIGLNLLIPDGVCIGKLISDYIKYNGERIL